MSTMPVGRANTACAGVSRRIRCPHMHISGLHLYYKWTHEADTLLCPNDVSVEMCYSPPNDGGYKSDDYSFPGETTDIPIPPQEPIGRPGVKPPPQSWPTPPPINSGGPEGF